MKSLHIASLKPHPLNSKIYSNGNTDDLEASIQENGLLDPIIISKDNTIISGHRRWNACKNIGLENVDVRVEDFQDESIALVELNRYRNKKASELLAEIFLLEKEYSKKIKRGRPKKGVKLDTLKNGKVRDRIAKLTGVSTGNLSKLKYIHRVWPDIISLIDDGKVTINQTYVEAKRKEVFKNIQVTSKNGVKKSDKTAITDRYKIYNKSSMNMSELEDGSIQTIMTSPPYFNQRNYGNNHKESIGLEKTIDAYLDNLMKVFKECFRVLSYQGSCFIVIGDKYVNGELMSIPHRFAIRMMDNGYKQQNCIIWRKTNPKPSSIKNRLQNSYEFIFWFTKSKDYYFDSDSIRQPYKQQNGLKDVRAPRHFSLDGNNSFGTPIFQNPLGRIPSDFTDIIETSKVSYGIGKKLGLEIENNAAYPPQICVNPVISTSREGDLVLDTFMGSGTTGEVSLRLKRKFVGYDLNRNFCTLSNVRLQKIIEIEE